MKDLNFFENYLEKPEFNIDTRLIIYFTAIILALFIVIYTVSTQVKIRSISKDIAKLQTTIEDERINQRIENIKEKQAELDEFSDSLEQVQIFDNMVEEENIIDSYLLESIVSKMPEDVFFTSISIYSEEIQIVGNAKDKWAIAQLQKNLESIEDFHQIFISNISSEEGYCNFILNIYLKDVNMDNGEASDEATNDKKVETEEETHEESDEE